ncbi:MAG: lipid II:glycine glycyltransferase FemX [Pseudonocardiaceae bacterium]
MTARRKPAPELLSTWDALVDNTPGTDVTQLSSWAQLRETAGFTPLYVLAYRAAELVGGALIMSRRVPLLGAIGYLPYGPLVASGVRDARDARGDVRRALADALKVLCKRHLRMLFVQPPEGGEDMSDELLRRGFRPSSAGIAPAGSIRIDLTADLTEIRSRFGKRLKSWTNRWPSRGVTVRLGDEQDVALLVRLMDTSSQYQGYQPLPAGYVATLYRELAATGHAALFVGEVDGVPVAADLVTGCAGMIRGRLSGFDRSEETAKLSVPAAVRWETLQWAKASGYQWFDFGGLRPETLDALLRGDDRNPDSWPSADQPKLTFGGTAYRYPTPVELIRPAPLRIGYDLARRSAAGHRVFTTAKNMFRGSRADSSRK